MDAEKGFRSEKIKQLSRFSAGLFGTVVDLPTDTELLGSLMGMGLFVGTRFCILQGCESAKHPFLIAVGDTRIAVGHEIAETILAES